MKVTTLNEIHNEATGILCNLETIEGQMSFFSYLIQDVRDYKDTMSSLLKIGELEKQLDAIYTLFHYQLKEIEKSRKEILMLLERGLKENGEKHDNQEK